MKFLSKKILTLFSLSLSFYPLNFLSSCSKCIHEKDTLLSICIDKQNIARAGKYQCKHCGQDYIDSFSASEIGMPIIDISGDPSLISKETKQNMSLTYFDIDSENDFSVDCTIKFQGSGSLAYPKKNYNIQFFERGSGFSKKFKRTMKPGWTNESKYTLKANWIDCTESRNIVSSKIWGDVIHQRQKGDEVDKLLNGGAVDGFPILLFFNGILQGLYTFNIAKDKQLFETPDGSVKPKGVMNQNLWTKSTEFREPIASDLSNGWEIEYNSESSSDWMINSFNNFINFVINNEGQDFKDGISNYADIDRIIDYLIYVNLLCVDDNITKNILWVTYDKIKWTPVVWDADTSCGIYWDGYPLPYNYEIPVYTSNLFTKVFNVFESEYKTEYFKLRNSSLSHDNIISKYNAFLGQINNIVYTADRSKWPTTPATQTNDIFHINDFMMRREAYFDNKYKE